MNILERKLKEFREKVVEALEAINLQLSSLRTDVQNQTKAISESAKATEKQRQVIPKVIAEAHFPPTIETKKCEEDTKGDNKHQRWVLLLNGLTLIAVTWYACEAHKQSGSVQESANAAYKTRWTLNPPSVPLSDSFVSMHPGQPELLIAKKNFSVSTGLGRMAEAHPRPQLIGFKLMN